MKFNSSLRYEDFIGHQTFLYGETNTKKTYYTAKFIQFLIESRHLDPKEISILDFAPPQSIIKQVKIGGKIKEFYKDSIKCNNLFFKGEIIPPRLKAKNIKELYDNACKNFKKTYSILNLFIENPTSVLIINDISIYLHIGNKNLLLEAIEKSNTFFGNSYYGSSIKSDFATLFSLREKRLVEYLMKKVEFCYFTE
ncbi:MAG: hypothetical protein HWN81_12110 [Candidatus Lokiarchaeota archaeon]|nr:hypothetical protein [Candidatus Lokiarchaeota archaeon]